MSEYEIPFRIQEEIMKRLPAKSLVRFRCVSKAWKSLIDSPRFIIAHSHHNYTRPHHLLVSNRVSDEDVCFSSYIDDDTFPRKSSVPTVPFSFKQLFYLLVTGSSHGLICVDGYDKVLKKKMAVIWNPCIRKSVAVPVYQPVSEIPYSGSLGFGVCPATGDPKLLLIIDPVIAKDRREAASVYTLSSGEWTTPSPTMPGGDWVKTTTTKKFIYSRPGRKNIMSFDLTRETFGVIDLPDGEADFSYASNIRESLALIRRWENMCTVWWLDDNDSFRNLYKINVVPNVDRILGFRKNRKPIMIRTDCDDPVDDYDCYDAEVDEPPSLVDYDPIFYRANDIPISKLSYGVNVQSYMETVLLLDCNTAITD